MENYDKIKEIGKGSYGVVWLVKSKREKKNYVLKRIDLRKTSDRDKMSAQQEAQLLKSLKHPNIVSYRESFQIDGYLNIVMLFCDGGDLYTKIKEQNGKYLEETQIVEWFVQIAMALQYLHDKNILHRDLKTQNIFLTKNKIIKVGDLGIARVLKSNNDMATTIIGTPYYMSPELFTNKPYNSKSDVWALGCCVYEMTTLRHAFNAKDMTSLVLKITRGKMPSLPDHYSKELVLLIESMLNPEPKNRPSVGRILRDPFIKKNIMLFLERTKLKQQQQQQQQPIIENRTRPEIQEVPVKQPLVKHSPPKQINKSSSSDSDTEVINSSSNKKNIRPEPVEENRKQNLVKASHPDENKNPQSARPRVRISSLVEDIETKQYFKLDQIPKRNKEYNDDDEEDNEEEDNESSDEKHKPYELTKPIKLSNQNELKSNYSKNEIKKSNDDTPVANHQPKIVNQSYSIMPKRVASAPTDLAKAQNSSSQAEEKPSAPVALDARERRRQRLRLSQNESDSFKGDSKPPILRRLEKKSHNSDVFYDSNKSNVSNSNSANSGISRSYDLPSSSNNKNDPHLQDSLKIFRKINPTPPQQLFNKDSKLQLVAPKSSKPLTQSSSSSSLASSNEDIDPDAELIRAEKKKKRDQKEMNNFIDQLSSTLKLANLSANDTEVDDIKDEVLDDLEEEAIQAEMNSNENDKQMNSSNNNNKNNPNNAIRSKRATFLGGSLENDDDNDISNSTITQRRPIPKPRDLPDSIPINNNRATNHMQNRIIQLENEIVSMIGREKLNEAFKILESFKEEECEPKLVRLIGPNLYASNSSKLWLLKFCKDTAKINIR